ncbi:MAG TPA: small metal-binding protein SmbP [Nitrospirales bacterium]|nr:small metal-binding protein SmbP [Nitrospirales bacterium]
MISKVSTLIRIVGCVGVLGFLAVPAVTLAEADKHLHEAIGHAGEAKAHGEMGHAGEAAKHAEEALLHADAAKQEGANAHVGEGISHLGEAVDHSKQGHGEVAGEHSQEALRIPARRRGSNSVRRSALLENVPRYFEWFPGYSGSMSLAYPGRRLNFGSFDPPVPCY